MPIAWVTREEFEAEYGPNTRRGTNCTSSVAAEGKGPGEGAGEAQARSPEDLEKILRNMPYPGDINAVPPAMREGVLAGAWGEVLSDRECEALEMLGCDRSLGRSGRARGSVCPNECSLRI